MRCRFCLTVRRITRSRQSKARSRLLMSLLSLRVVLSVCFLSAANKKIYIYGWLSAPMMIFSLFNCQFQCSKQKDLYLWMAKCSNGPSVKFLVNAVHAMEELKFIGNHVQGSQPLLTFSSNFDNNALWKLLKKMITQIFQRSTGNLSHTMIMCLSSPLLMTTFGSGIIRYRFLIMNQTK